MPSQRADAPIWVNGAPRTPGPTGVITIGRDPAADVTVDHPKVSKRHGTLRRTADGWSYRDEGSRNGSFLDGRPVQEFALPPQTTLILGSSRDGAELHLRFEPDGTAEPPRPSSADGGGGSAYGRLSGVYRLPAALIRIGRGEDNDLVLTDLRVSRRHADLRRMPDGSRELVDLGSHNGTFVNGVRIDRALISIDDLIGIGGHLFRATAETLEEYVERGAVGFRAADLSVNAPDGRTILRDVSFAVEASSLVAVVGPSGAGKTTLLNALTGFRPANRGGVIYGGRDLYDEYEDLRQRMGYVPQEDILHTQLPLRRALAYAARLRFAPDVPRVAVEQRVDQVLRDLGLADRAGLRIDNLSGGQRKRASVALELMTRPSLMFLDEPTSGLDPGHEENVMQLLRSLADGGRIVIVVTHSTQSLYLCDRLLFLAPGGVTAFFGRPSEALDYFRGAGAGSEYPEIFRRLDEDRTVDWQARFRADAAYGRALPGDGASPSPARRQGAPGASAHGRDAGSRLRQWSLLTQRYVAVIANDRRAIALLAVQAPFFALLYLSVFWGTDNLFSVVHGLNGTLLLWLVVIGATWLGTSNAIREVVKESSIYRRERSFGLSIGAYIGSKAAVLGSITLIQCVLLAGVIVIRYPLPPTDTAGIAPAGAMEGGSFLPSATLEFIVGVILAGLAAMALGLLLSTLVRTSDRALVLLPLVLVAQIVLSIPFLPVSTAVLDVPGYVSSAQWGAAATGSTVSLNYLRGPYVYLVNRVAPDLLGSIEPDPALIQAEISRDLLSQEAALDFKAKWRHEARAWLLDVGALLALTLVCLLAAVLVLHRRDPNK